MITTQFSPSTEDSGRASTSPTAAIAVLVLTAVLSLTALVGPNLVASELGMSERTLYRRLKALEG